MAMFEKIEEMDGCMEGLVNEGELERNKNFQHNMRLVTIKFKYMGGFFYASS